MAFLSSFFFCVLSYFFGVFKCFLLQKRNQEVPGFKYNQVTYTTKGFTSNFRSFVYNCCTKSPTNCLQESWNHAWR